MATIEMNGGDDRVLHKKSAQPVAVDVDGANKSNGHTISPVAFSQRLFGLDSADFPDVPSTEPTSSSRSKWSMPATQDPQHLQIDSYPTMNGAQNGHISIQESSIRQTPDKEVNVAGPNLLPGRRSVQFAREFGDGEPVSSDRIAAGDTTENPGQTPSKERPGRIFGKLRSFATLSSTTVPSRAASGHTPSDSSGANVLAPSDRDGTEEGLEPTEDAYADVDADADIDEDSDDVATTLAPTRSPKRKAYRPRPQTAETAPMTPRTSRLEQRFASFMREPSATNEGSSSTSRPTGLKRSKTPDPEGFARVGLSEDEGRVRNAWRRGIDGARGLSYHTRNKTEGESPSATRPNQLRRITGLTEGTSFFGREKLDRQTTTSAQKWRQVKAGLKLLGQRKRDERTRVDHQKSAQLMAELLAGSPAALVLASMFQRDENDNRKIPVLLEQLKIRIVDSIIRNEKDGDRHLAFKIDLEYGNGPARMQWTISRTLKDFVNMHAKYQASAAADKVRHFGNENRSKAKMPRFPRSAFPYGRNIRGLFDNLEDEDKEDEEDPPQTPGLAMLEDGIPESPRIPATPLVPGGSWMPETPGPEGATTGPTARHVRRKSSAFGPGTLRRSSTAGSGPMPADPTELNERQLELYQRRQRRKLETYLQQMIRWLIFRPDSTRLCKFLEISALAIRLSAEGGYQGKQGLLTIASRRNKELRRKRLELSALKDRHHARWFLVRHSYIVCVDGPESLKPYDVFMVDSDFRTTKRKAITADGSGGEAVDASKSHGKHALIRLYNSERKLKLLATQERHYWQFQESINSMAEATIWSKKQRFASYAPVRHNVWCRWLVDGRDHTWQVSRAIDNAKDFVYIHDWWLSPELYMRRPAAISQKWRLDRLLQRKAQEGVKIFVIVYRNIESAMPIDSEYTKWSLLDLHPNICIQRSPNQFRQNQFFWAHHEKTVVVDNMMAFVGGIDLCFGRWDDPCHSLTDDKLTGFELDHVGPRDSEHCQMWPGKDYSNPRVQDFYNLDRPYEEMYDRTRVPRMPWHDISMQIVGQPARDVARHFVQRWNYILRSRIPSRPTPVLLPPPEYEAMELDSLGMTGTCQVQILRSVGPWSIGTPNRIEHSIMNAYVHLIEHSDHFVYMENQFFITSCIVEGTTIHNKIGDALVERIIRAYDNDEAWQACIVIPLMPGFQNSVDSQDGTSIRLIMQCQFRSICRGEGSIFGRVRARGIDPEDYIRFYGLRQWGKIGPRKCLTTEQLYVHAKCMVVDDRSVIIGSANINERSMLGNRDSEVAAVVTDTRMIPSYMGGEPYEVGEFAHTLRKRLMREHLGVDVDAVYRKEQAARQREEQDSEMARIYRETNEPQEDYFSIPNTTSEPLTHRNVEAKSTSGLSSGLAGTTRVGSTVSLDHSPGQHSRKEKLEPKSIEHDKDVDGLGFDNMKAIVDSGDVGLTDSYTDSQGREVMVRKDAPNIQRVKETDMVDRRSSASSERTEPAAPEPPYPIERQTTAEANQLPRSQLPELPTQDDTDIGGPPLSHTHPATNTDAKLPAIAHTLKRPTVTEDCMTDPLASPFFHEIWHRVAENNTKLYRQVFRCMPDSDVTDWKQYERYNALSLIHISEPTRPY